MHDGLLSLDGWEMGLNYSFKKSEEKAYAGE